MDPMSPMGINSGTSIPPYYSPYHSHKNPVKYGKLMDVSKNGGTPKWMAYNGKPY